MIGRGELCPERPVRFGRKRIGGFGRRAEARPGEALQRVRRDADPGRPVEDQQQPLVPGQHPLIGKPWRDSLPGKARGDMSNLHWLTHGRIARP